MHEQASPHSAPPDRVRIFDTTLRDGEQAPGFSLDVEEKLRMAAALARLRVDVIEAGFPASSQQDFDAVTRIAAYLDCVEDGPIACGLARCHAPDIDRAAEALSAARRRRLHVFLATSDLHLASKLRIDRKEAIRRIVAGVTLARRTTDDVEFSPEDGSRTDPDFLLEAVRAAVDCGATTINIPDTVGYATPDEMARMIERLRGALPDPDAIVLSVHCHDDLGLAVANSLAAVRAGARQVECTVNGIGERAGNAALEEVVMALATRPDEYRCSTRIDTRAIADASRLLATLTGVEPTPNKAIVGANAFAHEAGIHQHGIIADRRTYEIMRAEDVGRRGEQLVLGKHSGRHALALRLEALGIVLEGAPFERLFEDFKLLCAKRKKVFDGDLVALVVDQGRSAGRATRLESLHVVSGTHVTPTATVRVELDQVVHTGVAVGDGPVDAAFRAIDNALGVEAELTAYHVTAAAPGKDALGSVQVTVRRAGIDAVGRGLSTDTVEAAARAYLGALDSLARRDRAAQATASVSADTREEVQA